MALTKNGSGTQVLTGNNTYTGSTTINGGTLRASGTGALGSTSSVVVNNGGLLLVAADNAVNDSASMSLNGGKLALSGTFNESVGALSLGANSTIDFSGFVGTLRFASISTWSTGATLSIWNWTGAQQNGSNLVFDSGTSFGANLDNIKFFSDGGSTSLGIGAIDGSFVGSGFRIIAVPEPESCATAALFILATAARYLRRKKTAAES